MTAWKSGFSIRQTLIMYYFRFSDRIFFCLFFIANKLKSIYRSGETMKKAIMILLMLMLVGCAVIERKMLPDAKKPEMNVLTEPVSGVTITELDFTTQFPKLTDAAKASVSVFYTEGNLLYFAYSEYSNSAHAGVPIAKGIYTYNLDTKVYKTILTFDPKKEFYVSSIAVLNGKIYFSGGYPFGPKKGECKYEISVLSGTKVKTILSESAYSYRDIPKLFKFDSSSLVFLQIHHEQLNVTDYKSSFKITQIRSDASPRSSTEYAGTVTNSSMNVGMPMMDTISIDGMNFAYAVYKNSVASIYSATYDPQTGLFTDSLPIKIGEEVSPQFMSGFGNHWYVSSYQNSNMQLHLDVFDQTTGKKIATQILAEGAQAFMLTAFDASTGICFGDFESGNGSAPIGIGRLFLAHIEGSTVKYQRIDKIRFNTWPTSFAKMADKKFLVKGRLDLNEPVYRYLILEIK